MNEHEKEFEVFLKQIGKNIKKYRKEAGLKQEDMDGGQFPIDYKFFQRIEYGEKNITLKTFFKICKKLNIEPVKLLEFVKTKKVDK